MLGGRGTLQLGPRCSPASRGAGRPRPSPRPAPAVSAPAQLRRSVHGWDPPRPTAQRHRRGRQRRGAEAGLSPPLAGGARGPPAAQPRPRCRVGGACPASAPARPRPALRARGWASPPGGAGLAAGRPSTWPRATARFRLRRRSRRRRCARVPPLLPPPARTLPPEAERAWSRGAAGAPPTRLGFLQGSPPPALQPGSLPAPAPRSRG